MFFNTGMMEELAALWLQTPLVISARMQSLALSAITGGSQGGVEIDQMISEKFVAAVESLEAVNRAFIQETLGAAAALAAGKWTMASSADRMATAALKPYAVRVSANAVRLSSRE